MLGRFGLKNPECTMQGDPKVIDYLNKGLRSELTAISQYWLHYRLLNNWGLLEMAKVWRKESIEEMEHADKFTDRILFRARCTRKRPPIATASRTTSRATCSSS